MIRCRGERGLCPIVKYRVATSSRDPEHVAKKLAKMLRVEAVSGIDLVDEADDLERFQKWFEKFEADYLGWIPRRSKTRGGPPESLSDRGSRPVPPTRPLLTCKSAPKSPCGALEYLCRVRTRA